MISGVRPSSVRGIADDMMQLPPAQDDSDHTTAQSPDSKTSASLAGLPTEIRLMIYEYLFEKSGTIHITKCIRWAPRAVQQSFDDKPTHYRQGLTMRDAKGKWMSQEPSTAVLAQVSAQIALEVVPIIYAGKTFEFQHAGDLDRFLKCIGGAVRYVEAIQLQGPLDTFKLEAWARLQGAVELRSLRVDHQYVKDLLHEPDHSRIMKPAHLVDCLTYFLHAHRKARQEKASGRINTRGVVELVRIEHRNSPEKMSNTCLCCRTWYNDCESWLQGELGRVLRTEGRVAYANAEMVKRVSMELGIEPMKV